MKKNDRFITIVSLIISIFGLICCAYSVYDKQIDEFSLPMESRSTVLNVLLIFKTLNLNFTNEYKYWDVYNLIFYALLLVGTLQFIVKKSKETRLLGFVYSVIFLSSAIQIILSLVAYLSINFKTINIERLIYGFLGTVVLVATFIASYKILKIIKSSKEIDITETAGKTVITDTGKWQRAFHWLIDLTVMALLFIPFGIVFAHWISENQTVANSPFLTHFFQGKISLYFLIFIVFFIYYPVTEIIFGSSPAKFLTESRLINSRAQHPSTSSIFTRTLCRHIPFEAFSFLGKRGWHDSISETFVVKEKRTGFKTNKLLWMLPVLGIYLLLVFFGREYYESYLYRQSSLKATESKLKFLESEIKNPNINQFFVVKKVGYYGNVKNYGFKIEKVDGNNITIKRITGEYYTDPSFEYAKHLYLQQKDTAKTFEIPKERFVKMYPKTNEELYDPNRTLDFFDSGVHYGIEEVYYFNAPYLDAKIARENEDFSSQKAIIFLQNLGGSGKISAIKNKDHEMKWNASLPINMSSGPESGVTLHVDHYDFSDQNETEIEVTDSLHKKHLFLLKTEGLTATIRKLHQ